MKKEHINILCCPYCYGNLTLKIQKSNEKEIIDGQIICKACNKIYMIKEGIPTMI